MKYEIVGSAHYRKVCVGVNLLERGQPSNIMTGKLPNLAEYAQERDAGSTLSVNINPNGTLTSINIIGNFLAQMF